MALQDYLKVLSRHKIFIISITILTGLFAFVFLLIKPISYDVFLTLSIYRANKEQTNDFQYDNYYAIQSAELLSNTVIGWLESVDVVYEIYKKADILPPKIGLNKLTRQFKGEQLSSHLIKISFNCKNEENAQKLASALISVIQEKVKSSEVTQEGKPAFNLQTSDPIIIQKRENSVLVVAIALICGLLASIGFSFLFEYFRKE